MLVDGRLFCHSKKPMMISNMTTTKDKARPTMRNTLCLPGKIIDILLRKFVPTVVK